MKNLKERINALEQQLNDHNFVPGLIFFDTQETEEQARERYKREHGFDYPENMQAICIEVVDCRKPMP